MPPGIPIAALSLLLASLATRAPAMGEASKPATTTALVGATVVDVSDFGHGSHDLPDSTVLIKEGLIEAVGRRSQIAVPDGARVIDATGKYILPGLVDGFAGMNSQGQASAYLYMGVTTLGGSSDDRRGQLFLNASPRPHVYLLDGTGSTDDSDLLAASPEWAPMLRGRKVDVELSWDETSRMMDEQAKLGVRGLWLGHNLTAEKTRLIIIKARILGMATYGEFVSTPFSDAIEDGVSLLLHMNRYNLGLIPPGMQRPLAADPEGAAADKAYAFADAVSPDDPSVGRYARMIAEHHVALMPTLGLYYLDLPGHRNLWRDPAAALLDPKGVFKPADPATGEPVYSSERSKAWRQRTATLNWALNQAFLKEHPVFLAASGGAVFGSLPGISMHTEMELLVRLGLTPREAIAAATSNYSEMLGWQELGLVAKGRRADLLVLDGDPTADILGTRRIHMVLMDGEVVDREALLRH